jgi:hypothetical protein
MAEEAQGRQKEDAAKVQLIADMAGKIRYVRHSAAGLKDEGARVLW